tara:strand:- start:107 stop:847 length:741 start_codon:yes stop_codon:yes gene_type:complete
MKLLNFVTLTERTPDPPDIEDLHDGVYVNCIKGAQPSWAEPLRTRCWTEGKLFVLGFQFKDQDQLRAVFDVYGAGTNVSLGTDPNGEWSPGRHIQEWHALCRDWRLRFCCPLIHIHMMRDLQDQEIRDQLLENQTPVFVLCGHQLARYALGQSVPSHRTCLMDMNPREQWGVTPDALTDWLAPLDNTWSGLGGPRGFQRGSHLSCLKVWFKGGVCSNMPSKMPRVGIDTIVEQPNLYSEQVDPEWI